jgi:hypothetical protein
VALGIFLGAAAVAASTAFACEAWEKAFELSAKDAHFVCVLAGRGSEWIAGGIGVVASGEGQTQSEQIFAGSTIEALGVAPDGAVYAVGAQGAIWKRVAANEWREEHRSRPAGSKGTRKVRDLLVGVRAVPHQSRSLLFAYGPGGSPSLIRDEQGAWKEPAPELQRELIAIATSGPKLDLPGDCRRDRWRWMDGGNGMAFCSDGRTFALLNGEVVAAGKAPKACDFVTDVVRRGSEIFACCGRDGRVFKFAEGQWSGVPGAKDIFALAANDQCLVAASDRTIWQQCLPSKAGGERRGHGVAQERDAGATRK